MGNNQAKPNDPNNSSPVPVTEQKAELESEEQSHPYDEIDPLLTFCMTNPNARYNDDEEINTPQILQPIENHFSSNIDDCYFSSAVDDHIPNSPIDDAVHLSLQLKRRVIQSSSTQDQTFPLLASLKVDDIMKTQAKAPLDLVCVIDKSMSMFGPKINLVKKAFSCLLKYLGDNDRLSIVLFNPRARRLTPLLKTTEENKNKILDEVNAIHPAAGTNITAGMIEAFHILNQRKFKNPVTSIMLLTDGCDGAPGSPLEKIRKCIEIMKLPEDITIHTFGFGKDHDPQLMSDVANLRDGNFYCVNKLDVIDEAFVDCLGGLLSAVGQKVSIKIKPEQGSQLPGVKIVKAHGEPIMWKKEGDAFITKFSNLVSGSQKDFVLELGIPATKKVLKDHEKEVHVVSAEATFTGLDGRQRVVKSRLNVSVLNEGEEVKEEEEDNREVMKHFYRVKVALVIDEARKLADKAMNEGAKRVLEAFKDEVQKSFLKNEEFIQNLIKDIEQTIKNIAPTVYENHGRHQVIENARAHMYQTSNITSAVCYQSSMQSEMTSEVKAMKSKS